LAPWIRIHIEVKRWIRIRIETVYINDYFARAGCGQHAHHSGRVPGIPQDPLTRQVREVTIDGQYPLKWAVPLKWTLYRTKLS
jgi:hypothetical protein